VYDVRHFEAIDPYLSYALKLLGEFILIRLEFTLHVGKDAVAPALPNVECFPVSRIKQPINVIAKLVRNLFRKHPNHRGRPIAISGDLLIRRLVQSVKELATLL